MTLPVHWYYPSCIIPCGLSIDELKHTQITCSRAAVTCSTCFARLQADKLICAACRWLGDNWRGENRYDSRDPNSRPNPYRHMCDPRDRGAA